MSSLQASPIANGFKTATIILCFIALFYLGVLYYRNLGSEDNVVSIFATLANNQTSTKALHQLLEFRKLKKLYESSRSARLAMFQRLYQGHPVYEFGDLYNGLVPEVWCPSLVRVGDTNDGGKWMCRPWGMPKDCAVYSLGVNEDTSFERELQHITNSRCRVYSYDMNTPQNPDVLANISQINMKFKKATLSSIADPAKQKITLQSELLLHLDDHIEILKMDIEGSEFDILEGIADDVSICQILVEMHRNSSENVQLLNSMARRGFRLFSYEINGVHHELSEFSLIHDSCLHRYESRPLAYYLDAAHL